MIHPVHKRIIGIENESVQLRQQLAAAQKENAALAAQVERLKSILTELRDACKLEPSMNHMRYDPLGVRVNHVISEPPSTTLSAYVEKAKLEPIERALKEFAEYFKHTARESTATEALALLTALKGEK